MTAPWRSFRAATVASLAAMALLFLSACSVTGGSSANAGGSGNGADAVVASMKANNFRLCSWLDAALSKSETRLTVMIESPSANGSPVESTGLIAGPAGAESFDQVSGINKVECIASGTAHDPVSGEVLTGRTTAILQYSERGFPGKGFDRQEPVEEYGGYTITRSYIEQYANAALDDHLRLTVIGPYGGDTGPDLTVLKLLIDTWNGGNVGKPQGGNAAPAPAPKVEAPSGSSSDPSAGVALVRGWGKAGFPSPSEQPGWYCDLWTDKDTQEANRIAQIKENPGWSWKVDDELDREPAQPRAVLVITGPESSQNATPEIKYNVTLGSNNGKWCLGSVNAKGVG